MISETANEDLSSNQKVPLHSIVDKQRVYFQNGNTSDIALRCEVLKSLEVYLVSHREELLKALAKDLDKPHLEAFLSEYYFLIQEIRLVCKSLQQWQKPRRVKTPFYFKPCKSEVLREPFGVVLIMAPWNYPIQLALSPLIAAIAAGNTVVLKPSEISTASEKFLVDLVKACFLPEHVAVVTGGKDVSEALLDIRYDFVFFTGSTAIGKVVAGKIAQHLTPSVLELGGKCPCIVDSTVDVDVAARRILAGKFFNAGQTCFSPDFVAVHEDVQHAFIEACKEILTTTPWDEEMASIINIHHYQRLRDLLTGREIKNGEDDPECNFLAARILPDADWNDEVLKEEVFGPILPIVAFSNRDELLERLRTYGAPLALYLFSENEQWVHEVQTAIPSGGVCVNDTMKQGINLELPFGGVGESGHGRYRGQEGFLAMTYQRGVVTRSARIPQWLDLMPPYEKAYQWMARWMK
ncbi:MAG: aldehyde dehydrogenase family protein [Akkermansiaceae bacterium]